MYSIDLLRSWKHPARSATATRMFFMARTISQLLRIGSLEDERIRHDDDAALRLGKLPAADRAGDARRDRVVAERRALHHRGRHLSVGGDGERDVHFAGQLGVARELLLVTEAHLVEVALHDAPDDLAVEAA